MIGQPVRRSTGSLLLYPAYVQDYLDRVTAADVAAGNTQGLERGVTDAFNQVLQSLVADTSLGVSGNVIAQAPSTIKAMPFMCGARTISGCLVPVVGPAPMNFNFTGARYDRKLGLLGDGATTYLSTNRNSSADPQNNCHLSAWRTNTISSTNPYLIGAAATSPSVVNAIGERGVYCNTATSANFIDTGVGFYGISRNSSANYSVFRPGAGTTSVAVASTGVVNFPVFVFNLSNNGNPGTQWSPARISMYSQGENIDMPVFRSRIATLMSTLAALSL
jgi:hypothetical protein